MIGLALLLGVQAAHSPILVRKYEPDTALMYVMNATNKDSGGLHRYSVWANSQVVSGADGNCFEWVGWDGLKKNDVPVDLPHSSLAFREVLSLDPAYQAPLPDLSKVVPDLIGPVTDMLTFYADLNLAMRQQKLDKPGTHVFVKYGMPASWADGEHVLMGQDAIDFDVTLNSVDRDSNSATVTVQHVPPSHASLNMPAEWMNKPIEGNTPNNWAQVTRQEDGSFLAGVGRETFNIVLIVNLSDGSIRSAREYNVVDVVERKCVDENLANPGPPKKSRIVRHILLDRFIRID